jgi:hypothetical protein
MTWQNGISDVGAANLRFCDKLESVNLMGTPTGDGVIEALRDKPALRSLDTGKLVTDAGLAMLHDIPALTRLLIDGPFTNQGLATLAGLEGINDLDIFWHAKNITPEAFGIFATLPNLQSLGCDGELSNDTAMRHFAAIPGLRKLRAQSAVATDDGFEALSQSTTLEQFWGRECPNFTSRGFVALSRMPALRSLGIGCRNVDDTTLATLPRFPALRELTSIGISDEGFRHIGNCANLERLSCMYCRDTTDIATTHIASLQLKHYYAGATQITDRTLEILSQMPSLESIELYETKGITDAGLQGLANLPRLRELILTHLPQIAPEAIAALPAHLRVKYKP